MNSAAYIPLGFLAVAAIGLLAAQAIQRLRQRRNHVIYRSRYLQLASELDALTLAVNHLSGFVSRIKSARTLDFYEGCLRMLRDLLEAADKHPPFGDDPGALEPEAFLVRDCRVRCELAQRAFRDALQGDTQIDIDPLFGRWRVPASSGCFFCSRPLVSTRFAPVRVRLEGGVKEVVACMICKDELAASQRVKILYFEHRGRRVHWSDVPHYHPTEHYWNINNHGRTTFKPIRLVYANDEQLKR